MTLPCPPVSAGSVPSHSGLLIAPQLRITHRRYRHGLSDGVCDPPGHVPGWRVGDAVLRRRADDQSLHASCAGLSRRAWRRKKRALTAIAHSCRLRAATYGQAGRALSVASSFAAVEQLEAITPRRRPPTAMNAGARGEVACTWLLYDVLAESQQRAVSRTVVNGGIWRGHGFSIGSWIWACGASAP
jgi:hypothetical protein